MSGMIYGYARVSTRQQDLSRQLDLLEKYNCQRIYTAVCIIKRDK